MCVLHVVSGARGDLRYSTPQDQSKSSVALYRLSSGPHRAVQRIPDMFSLIRRFSGSVIPRPDRPWADDPTSNAPRVGAKRRMADEDRDEDDEEQARLKKVRGPTNEAPADTRESSSTPLPPANETAGVQEVTEGVKEVELDEKPQALPESIPLPAEEAGELDADASSTASTPPPADAPSEAQATDYVPETTADPASAEAVSEPAEADANVDAQPSLDPSDVAVDSGAAATPAEARPIKKLRAKPQSITETAAAPTESAET
ncbi:hypothetical protein C8R45DRAFT_1002516 [Mycena sanguinolenta]|nr:hypothetical protein C8R45DRAFT_1002516 [Mycena sanguinolenta]